ncbi:sigma factor-like helix-turn-helix DNA-binding protein [Streptomyces sp. NPDC058773]|uniref:sigma factor-like helix-turn-helix DNA-binding protein n=1 Tax=Streptomyces sp. NPDC058773 TaxID=3346632 RepID=UPI0036A31F94
MRERRTAQERHHTQEFERFVAGAAGRLLHTATLLTGEPASRPAPAAEELLLRALSRTYAVWNRLRDDDPYEHTRRELAACFAHTARRHRRPRGGLLDRLSPRERLVLVLRLHEDVAEEQTAAQLGLPAERVHALCLHAVAELRSRRPGAEPAPATDSAGTRPSRSAPRPTTDSAPARPSTTAPDHATDSVTDSPPGHAPGSESTAP